MDLKLKLDFPHIPYVFFTLLMDHLHLIHLLGHKISIFNLQTHLQHKFAFLHLQPSPGKASSKANVPLNLDRQIRRMHCVT